MPATAEPITPQWFVDIHTFVIQYDRISNDEWCGNSLLIFTVLTIISYGCSLIVNAIAKPIEMWLMSKIEVKAKPIL